MTNRTPMLHATPSCRPHARFLRTSALGRVVGIALCTSLIALLAGCDRTMPLPKVRELQARGRYAETIEPLRQLLEASPDDPETHLLYGTALSRTGSGRVAVWSLRKAAENPAFAVAANLELSGTQARSGNWKEAIEAAEAVLETEPENIPAHVLRGEALLSEGKQPERALEDFDFVLDHDPTSLAALTARTATLLTLNRIDEAAEAIDQIESLAATNPTDEATQAQLCAVQAVLRQERGLLDEAEKHFDECLERFPAQAVVLDPAITFFDARGQRERSNAILEKALELAPQSLSYRRTLALRKEAAGDSARALALFEQGVETEDRELKIAALTELTNYHVERDELPEAIAAYEKALALVEQPSQVAILTHADLLARAGRHADALRVAKSLENETFVGLIEARVALDEGDPKRALARLDQVFPSWPNNAGARYYAARAAEQMGDFARAIEEYRQSIRSAPEQTEAALRLAKLYLAAGALADASTNAWQYVTTHSNDPEGARVIVAAASRDETATLQGLFTQMWGTPLWPAAIAERARFVAEKKDAAQALEWLEALPGPKANWTDPHFAELLRERVLLLHAAGRTPEAEEFAAAALAAHPDSSELLEIRAALLEASGAEPSAIRAAFEQALAKNSRNWLALEGLARAQERDGDLSGAIEDLDRSTKLHPESPNAARLAADLAARSGAAQEAVELRWFELLKEHPWDAQAAKSLAELRKGRGQTDDVTLDYAERAVMFGGGEPAQALLVAVHEARGETARAKEVAKAFKEGKSIPPRHANAAGTAGPSPAAAPAAPAGADAAPATVSVPPSAEQAAPKSAEEGAES